MGNAPWWFSFVSFLAGYSGTLLTEWLRDRRADRRDDKRLASERQSRIEERDASRQDRLAGFQRETLLELQDAIQEFLRIELRAGMEDERAFHQTGVWRGGTVPDDRDEGGRLLRVQITRLRSRVIDDGVRELVGRVLQFASLATLQAPSPEAQNVHLTEMAVAAGALNDRIGESLRDL